MSTQRDSSNRTEITVHIDSSRLQEIDPFYANHIQLIPTRNEVAINFGRVDPPQIEESDIEGLNDINVTAKPVVRVIIPHTQFGPFAKLVARQYAAFLSLQGDDESEA